MAKLPRHHHLWHRASSTSSSRSAAAAVALSRRALQAYASQLQLAPVYTQRATSQQQNDEATAGVDDWEWTPSQSTANDVDHLIASTSAVTLEDLPRAVRLASVPRPRLLWSSSPLSYSSSSSSVAPTSASFSTSAPSRVTLQWLDPNPPEIVRTWTRSTTTRHPSSSSSRPSSPPDRTLPPADFDFAHHNHQSGNSFDLSEADVLSAATFAASSSYHGANGGGSSSGGGGSHGGGSGSHGGSSSSSSSSDGNGYSPGDVPPTLTSTTGQPARAHSPSSSSSTFDRHHSQAQAPIPPPILASSPSSARPHTGSIVSEASAAPQPSTSRTITLHHHHNHHDHSFAPLYEFRHGAYGIPKRHPLAAQKKKAAASASSSRGMLAAAADFLTGPVSAEPPPPPPRPAEEKQKSASPSPPHQQQQQQKLDPDTLRSVQVGEDSYFLRSDSFGIADGVGGWATRPGANPALFSRLLMHFCSVELSRYDEVMQGQGRKDRNEGEEELVRAFWEVDPVEVMHRAWERCVRISRREGILGSSTALLAMLRGDELRIANLGDCVLLIVRRGHLLFRSQEQQHSFNFPVQLGMKLKRGEQRGGSVETDRREAEKTPLVQVTAASLDEDLDAVEDEAGLLEQRRKSEEETRKASAEARRFEEEERQRERDERRRRAEFEGKDMALFDAELEAGKDFDFDPNSGGAATTSKNGRNAHEDDGEDGEEEGSRSTVYIGFDDSHPWDEPRRDCGRWTIQVQQGDVIILASDGLVDNLFDDDILEEVQRFAPPLEDIEGGHENAAATPAEDGDEWPPTDFSPQLLSEALCSRAKAVSQDSKAVISPFQQRATEEGLPYVGGKHDDISVLVAVVVGEAEGRLRLKR